MTNKKPFQVETYDAFETPPYSGRPLYVGSFDNAEEALACAKKVIDDQLRKVIESGRSAEDAVGSFCVSGEIPMILGEGRIYLQPFEYAKEQAPKIALSANYLFVARLKK